MAITIDQVNVAQAITNILLKVIVALCILVAFFIVLYNVCSAVGWENKAVFGALDGILGYTMYPLTKHFFPPSTSKV